MGKEEKEQPQGHTPTAQADAGQKFFSGAAVTDSGPESEGPEEEPGKDPNEQHEQDPDEEEQPSESSTGQPDSGTGHGQQEGQTQTPEHEDEEPDDPEESEEEIKPPLDPPDTTNNTINQDYAALAALPTEILYQVFDFLLSKDLQNMRELNHAMKENVEGYVMNVKLVDEDKLPIKIGEENTLSEDGEITYTPDQALARWASGQFQRESEYDPTKLVAKFDSMLSKLDPFTYSHQLDLWGQDIRTEEGQILKSKLLIYMQALINAGRLREIGSGKTVSMGADPQKVLQSFLGDLYSVTFPDPA